MERFDFEIRSTWDGSPLRSDEHAAISLAIGSRLEVAIEARFYADPAPPEPAGRREGLWDFEVVELFLLGSDERYLELEFGPFGHWLAYGLAGRRNVVAPMLAIEAFTANRSATRWTGTARIPLALLPPGLHAANAYAIHGTGPERRYLAWNPVPGEQPDFHRLALFAPLERARRATARR